MTVLIVDDSDPYRQRLRRYLETYPDTVVVGEARNGAEALAAIGSVRPAIVLLDLHMPGITGYDLLEHFMTLATPPAAVVLSANVDDRARMRCFTLRARSVIDKAHAPELLRRALVEALSGHDV